MYLPMQPSFVVEVEEFFWAMFVKTLDEDLQPVDGACDDHFATQVRQAGTMRGVVLPNHVV